jgi:hypothetical protein
LPQKPVQPFMVEQSEAVRQAHNDAFATHWGSAPRSEESWADLVGSRTFRPGPSGALDESVGFTAVKTFASYARQEPAAPV